MSKVANYGFIILTIDNFGYAFKMNKELYGLKQASRA